MNRQNVGILIFDNVEVLDFAGPYEVFSRTRLVGGVESRRSDESAPFRVFTVARTLAPVTATGGLRVLPDHDFAGAPPIDLLVVPGGFGTRPLLDDETTREWITQTAARAQRVTSVCTGALLLAKVGLLAGKRATTHWGALDLLASMDPTMKVERELRVVEDGIVTSAGVSAGIDMSLAVVE
jgi:transcriptional regulator GlxA family with amidase domain